MKSDLRPHTRRRRHAIGRLRSLSTGAAVAGIAGTAGFGVMAAMTWSGDPAATPLPTAAPNGAAGGASGVTVQPPTAGQARPAPGTGFGQPPTLSTPRSNRATGGHAATGGSH
jgi:hypothetical protein